MTLHSYDEAVAIILDAVTALDHETVRSTGALGRVLAADLAVPADFPDQPRSAVDGFAVGACDRSTFTVVGEVAAGGAPLPALAVTEAAAVMTGAVVPDGAQAVVMVERTTTSGDRLTVDGAIAAGDLINPAGSEARRGDLLVGRGERITGAVHAAIMCAGLAEVAVHRRPRVGVVVTGDEVRSVDQGPAPGQVFDTNSFIVSAVCEGLGCEVVNSRRVVDDEDATRRTLAELETGCDLIVTSGGVSVGRYDHVGKILRRDPDRLLLHGTAIKPGRPMHLARLEGGTLVFGLPGYPSSLLSCAFLYLVPALKKLSGRVRVEPRWLQAKLGDAMRYRPGRQYFNRASLELAGGVWIARDPGSQMSSHFLNFARVQGLVRMPMEGPPGSGGGAVVLPAGSAVTVLHLELELT